MYFLYFTPEVVVYRAGETLVYRGRIDDWFTDFGDNHRPPTERNLRQVLDAILAGQEVVFSSTEAIGCLIEY